MSGLVIALFMVVGLVLLFAALGACTAENVAGTLACALMSAAAFVAVGWVARGLQ